MGFFRSFFVTFGSCFLWKKIVTCTCTGLLGHCYKHSVTSFELINSSNIYHQSFVTSVTFQLPFLFSQDKRETEQLLCYIDSILQLIAQKQRSYLKDTTDFINFTEKNKISKKSDTHFNGYYKLLHYYVPKPLSPFQSAHQRKYFQLTDFAGKLIPIHGTKLLAIA